MWSRSWALILSCLFAGAPWRLGAADEAWEVRSFQVQPEVFDVQRVPTVNDPFAPLAPPQPVFKPKAPPPMEAGEDVWMKYIKESTAGLNPALATLGISFAGVAPMWAYDPASCTLCAYLPKSKMDFLAEWMP